MPESRPRSARSATPRRSLAVLGTMSDAGKTTLTAGLCRVLTNGGTAVVPFKAQNMSNNAAPALLPGGGYGEIGTAQALQEEVSGTSVASVAAADAPPFFLCDRPVGCRPR